MKMKRINKSRLTDRTWSVNIRVCFALFCFILLANLSCNSSSDINNPRKFDQTEYRSNNQHTGFYESTELNFPLSLKWKYFNSRKGIVSAPVVSNGTVFFGSFDRNLYALDADKGDLRWKLQIPSSIVTSPTVDKGTVFFGGMDGLLYAIDQETGKKKWSFETASSAESTEETFIGRESIETKSGDIHETQLDQLTYRINAAENFIKDKQMLPVMGISSSPIVSEGIIYFGTFSGRFYAVDEFTGKKLWAYKTNYNIDLNFCTTALNGLVFFSTGHHLIALDAKTGKEKWEIELENGIGGGTAVGVGDRILYDDGVSLHAFSADSGKELWSIEVGTEIGPDGGPAVKDGVAFMGNDKGYYALDVLTGKKRWENNDIKPGSTGIPPSIAGNIVYYVDLEGGIVALDTASGQQKGRYILQSGFNPSWQTTTPMAIADGVIYLGSMNGNLYAIQGS